MGIVDLVTNIIGGLLEFFTFGMADTSGMYGFDATAASYGSMVDYGFGGNDVSSGPAASMNDGTISPEGLVVKSPKGSIQLNKDDSAIVGTN